VRVSPPTFFGAYAMKYLQIGRFLFWTAYFRPLIPLTVIFTSNGPSRIREQRSFRDAIESRSPAPSLRVCRRWGSRLGLSHKSRKATHIPGVAHEANTRET
jgi:hypothetical protein